MMNAETVATKMLKTSIILTIGLLVIQLTIGFLANSQTIIADGISSSTGVIVSFFNIAVMKYIAKRNAVKYPFGKEALEPLIGMANFIIIFFIVVVVITNNVQMILSGGNNEVHTSSVILFGIFFTIFNLGGYRYFKSQAKNNETSIAQVVVAGWQFSTIVGFGIVLGFGFSYVLDMTAFSAFTPYTDPVLAVILMLVFAMTPIWGIKNCLKELMQAGLSDEIANTIIEQVERIDKSYAFSDKVMRLGKIGGKIMIELDYVIEKNSELNCISEQDQFRSCLIESFVNLPYKKWINVNFTGDMKLTERLS